jgi:DNA polymerase (family 10)
VERSEAARYLRRLALAADLLGEPAGRAAACRQAARTVAALPPRAWSRWLAGARDAADGIDPRVERGLRRLAASGRARDLESRLLRIPPGLFDILRLRVLRPPEVRALWREGRIVTPRQLSRACRRGALARIPGFDEATQVRLLERFRRARHRRTAWLRHRALELAAHQEQLLRSVPGVRDVFRAGELRRATEQVRRILWVVAADAPELAVARLGSLEGAAPGPAGAADRVRIDPVDGPPLEMIVVDPAHAPARLFLETGSRAHVRGVLRRLARRDGAFPVDGWAEGGPAAWLDAGPSWLPAAEEEIYARAGLAPVPPELREGRGEIAAARAGRLPRLVEFGDLRGVFHVHTNWSDGRATIPELVAAARGLGWSYVGVADHSRAAFYARGLDAERLGQQAAEIRRVQREFPDVRIFHGVECDILPHGALDLDDQALAALDYVIVSVHSLLEMDREAMTRRVVRALQHPRTAILGHPSGRLFHERAPYRLDWRRVFAAAADHGVAIEFNTTPNRLDLDWRRIRSAVERGIPICVNPDAHRLESLQRVAAGLETARKGWLTAAAVLNTRSREQLEGLFRERRARR